MIKRRELLAGLSCAPFAMASRASAQTDAPLIRVGAALDDDSTPLLYAKSAGMFARAGLNVDVQKFNSGSVIAAAVAGGSLEVGKVGTMAAVTSYARGLPFKVIAPVSGWNSATPVRGIIVAAGAPLRNARDFAGKTIAVSSLGDLDSYAAQTWFDQNGVDSKTIHFVELPPPAMTAAIDQGRIDGGVLGEPLLSAATDTKKYRLAVPCDDALGKHWDLAVIIAREDWIESHRATAESFIRVVHDANVYVAAHESEAAPLILQFIGIDPSAAKHVRHPARVPYLTTAGLQPTIDVAAKYKAIPHAFPAAEMISPVALKGSRG